MSTVRETVEVEVPLHTAYNQWTQFERVPAVHGRRGPGDLQRGRHVICRWIAAIGGKHRGVATAEIAEQLPRRAGRLAHHLGRSVASSNAGLVHVPAPGRRDTEVNLADGLRARPAWRRRPSDMTGTLDRRIEGRSAPVQGASSSTGARRVAAGAAGSAPADRLRSGPRASADYPGRPAPSRAPRSRVRRPRDRPLPGRRTGARWSYGYPGAQRSSGPSSGHSACWRR